MHVHVLRGCTPRPLAAYLKALAILRIVSEQKDPGARAFWKNDTYHLITTLDRQALESFLLGEWRPSPFPSPWNKGSGYFNEDDKGLAPIEASSAARFANLRTGIAAARTLTLEMAAAVRAERDVKEETNSIKDRALRDALRGDPNYKQRLTRATKECKRLKDAIQPECQRRWRGPELRWLRAAVVIDSTGAAKFPALLGTGGNDGKLDFTNNAYQRLGDLFDFASADGGARPHAAELLRSALFGDATPGQVAGAIGQYAPAASGGPNATSGALGKSLLNPWDLVLLLEGGLLFTAGSSRRLSRRPGAGMAAAPFAVRGEASGYGSASRADEGGRGEQWMPLWERPWLASELESVLSEGRCQLGARTSENTLDMARSVARLGVARGITSFERYGFLERNGKSNYAVPLGRWQVRPEPRAVLLDDLEANEWWPRVRRAARSDRAPASFARAERALADAAMGALAHGQEPALWASVLIALAQVEAQMIVSGSFTVKQRLDPVPQLAPAWASTIQDGSPEARLGLCLAGAGANHTGSGIPRDPVRIHWAPIDFRTRRFIAREKGLALGPRQVVAGRDAASDLIALVQRRLIEAESCAGRTLPIRARWGTAAHPADLAALVYGGVDLERTVLLARALAALDWANMGSGLPAAARSSHDDLDPGYQALRLAHLSEPLGDLVIPVDPEPVRLLAAGDASRGIEIVLRRLASHGVRASVRAVALTGPQSRLCAASLAFPISSRTAAGLARSLDPASFDKEPRHVD